MTWFVHIWTFSLWFFSSFPTVFQNSILIFMKKWHFLGEIVAENADATTFFPFDFLIFFVISNYFSKLNFDLHEKVTFSRRNCCQKCWRDNVFSFWFFWFFSIFHIVERDEETFSTSISLAIFIIFFEGKFLIIGMFVLNVQFFETGAFSVEFLIEMNLLYGAFFSVRVLCTVWVEVKLMIGFFSAEDSSKKHPFPCPCSYRTALTYYVDITAPVRTHILKELADYAADPADKDKLLFMASRTEEGKAAYNDWVIKDCRHVRRKKTFSRHVHISTLKPCNKLQIYQNFFIHQNSHIKRRQEQSACWGKIVE